MCYSIYFLCCSMYFYVVLCIFCVVLCIFYVVLCVFCVVLCIFVLFYVFFVLFYVFLCCSMYWLFCDLLSVVCVYMCTVLLPPGGYPIAVKYIISCIWKHILLVAFFGLLLKCLHLRSKPMKVTNKICFHIHDMIYFTAIG